MTSFQQLYSPVCRLNLRQTLQDFIRKPWRSRLKEPNFFTNVEPPAKFRSIEGLDFFAEHLVDDYDYSDIEGNVGRIFWALQESQCVGRLAHIIRVIFRRTPVAFHSDPTIFLNAPEWPEIERLASEALTLIEAEDARHGPPKEVGIDLKL